MHGEKSRQVAVVLSTLADVVRRQGDLSAARFSYKLAVDIFKGLDDRVSMVVQLNKLAE